MPSGRPASAASARSFVRAILGGEPHRIAHVEQRARAERAHVVGRHIGIGMHDADVFGVQIEHLGGDLREGSVRALPHVDRAGVERRRAVGGDVDDRDRRGRRDRGLETDGDAAAAADRAGAAIERCAPAHARGDGVEHLGDGGVLHRGAARLRPAFAQNILAAEFDRIDAEFARDQVGVALVGPDQLRNAETAQRAGRRAVGIERIGIDADVLDVVRPGAVKPDFCVTRGPISA